MATIDTNVLMTDYRALTKLDDEIVVSLTVVRELENHKSDPTDGGYNARKSIKLIDECLNQGYRRYKSGIETILPNKFTLFIDGSFEELDMEINDHKIIKTALDHEDTLYTNDLAMKIQAIYYGAETEGYIGEEAEVNKIGRVECVHTESAIINEIYDTGSVELDRVEVENEKVNTSYIFKNDQQSVLVRSMDNRFQRIKPTDNIYGVDPKSAAQIFYLDMLLDPKIELIFCSGIAGSGKTLLALAAAMHLNNGKKANRFDKIICTKSLASIGEDVGYLPGELDDKIGPKYMSFDDCLKFLSFSNTKVEDVKTQNRISYEYIGNMRGRTFPKSFIIIDECFPYDQKVITDNGKIAIGSLFSNYIKDKHMPKALSYNEKTKEFEYKRIIAAAHKGKRNLVEVCSGNKKIKCTDNHPFLTTDGWVKASDLKDSDYLCLNSFNMQNSRWLNENQLQVVIGSYLGDGALRRISNGIFRLSIIHGEDQSEYLKHKASIFRRLDNIESIEKNGYAQKQAYKFNTLSFGLPFEVSKTKKIECEQWAIKKLNEKGLAIWFMDDGSKFSKDNGARFHTESFSEDSVYLLSEMLINKFKIECKVLNYKDYFYISLSKSGYTTLCEIIAPYVHEELSYKIHNYESLNGGSYIWNNNYCNFSVSRVKNVVKCDEEPQHVFDIEVEDNHNFIACCGADTKNNNNGFIVHNCQNLDNNELKSVISRAGEGSKVVVLGDLKQIDTKRLSQYNNGLYHAQRKLCNEPTVGIISLPKSERSNIARMTAML